VHTVSNVIQKRVTSPPETSQPIWNAGSAAVQSSLVRCHLRCGSGAGRVVTRKLVGAGVAGLFLGAAVVSLFQAEFFRASQINPPDKSAAVLPVSDASETKDQGHKLAVRSSVQEQPGSGTYDFYLQRLFTDATPPISKYRQLACPYRIRLIHSQFQMTHLREFSTRTRADTRVTAAPPETAGRYQCTLSRIGSRSANEQN